MRNDEAFRAAQPLIQEVRELGFRDIETLADLRHQQRDYTDAVPILLYWLTKIHNEVVKEEIVRCLMIKNAPPIIGETLVPEFLRTRNELFKWTIGNALSVVADRSLFPQLLSIAEDRSHGRSRQMLVVGLGRFEDEKANAVLLTLLDDATVCGHAVKALGISGGARERAALIPFLQHEKSWIRREAKRAIAAIDRRLNREVKRRQRTD